MLNKLFCSLLVVIITASVVPCLGQSKDIPADLYKANTIPDSLKENAYSVVRYSTENTVVKGPGKTQLAMHKIVTILNEKAQAEAELVVPYNKKFNSINSVEMIIYDDNGKQIKKYHKGDMGDHSATDYETLASDERVLYGGHTIVSYPVTIETFIETTETSIIDLGAWYIQKPHQSVQNSNCNFALNYNSGFRYLNRNTSIKPTKTTVGGVDNYQWEVKNLKAIKPEEGSPYWRVFPKILFAMNNFEFYGIPGDLSSWQNYGKWQKALNADVCSLSPTREEEIRQMTANIKTDKEKVKFLYDYLQHNMRYINVQLGIGGLKPLSAVFVDQKKYGDCKALSNYMTALLKAVNIPSYFSIVRAGANEEPAEASFPNDNFNHIIVCVPLKGDTTWLECTSNTSTFGKLSSFTENRNALLVTEDGGKLVNTPKSKMEDNVFKSEVRVKLGIDGAAIAQVKTWTTGDYRDWFNALSAQKTDDQKKRLISNLEMKQPSALDIKYASDTDGVKEVDLDLEYDKFCDIATGDKQFYKPKVFSLWRTTLTPMEKRKTDYYFDSPGQESCVTTIDLPEGFIVETLPANTSLKCSYGNFDINYVYDAAKNQVVSTAKFNLINFVIPAAKYTEMQQYMDDVAKAQNKKLVIKKKA